MYPLVFSIITFIVLPIGIRGCLQIWRLRNKPFFIKRYPKFTIILILWICIWTAFCYPLDVAAYAFESVPYPLSDSNFFAPFGPAVFIIVIA